MLVLTNEHQVLEVSGHLEWEMPAVGAMIFT